MKTEYSSHYTMLFSNTLTPNCLGESIRCKERRRRRINNTPHPSGISTTSKFSLRYTCDNLGLCVRSHSEADGALSCVLYLLFLEIRSHAHIRVAFISAHIHRLAIKREVVAYAVFTAYAQLGVVKIIELGIELEVLAQIIAQAHAEVSLHCAHAHSGVAKLLAEDEIELVGFADVIAAHVEKSVITRTQRHA